MGDRHGSATTDLRGEQRNQRSTASEDVSKANSGKLNIRRLPISAHDHFADPLGRAHDAARLHRLIGGDQDELLHLKLHRKLGKVERALDVVEDRLARIPLHEWDVLVSGGVEDHSGAILPEHLLHSDEVSGVGDHRVRH